MAKFNLKPQTIPTPEEAYEGVLGINKSSDKIVELDLSLLDEIDNQPFRVNENKVKQYAESIQEIGLLEPIQVREKENGRYEILAGRHRARAHKLLGIDKIKCVVKNVDDDTARLILLKTNTDRDDDFLPSELGAAYLEAEALLQKSGTIRPSTSQVAEEHNTSRKQIYRYKRITYLVPVLRDMVDSKELSLYVGVELSHLKKENQEKVASYLILYGDKTNLSTDDAVNLKELEKEENFPTDINDFFFPPKSQKTKEKEKKIVIKIKLEEIQELLPAELTEQNEIKSYILDILGKSAQKAAINSNCT